MTLKSFGIFRSRETFTNRIFRGKKIFFIGGTGFVGKVTLSMLLHNWSEDTLVLMSSKGEHDFERYAFVRTGVSALRLK